MIKSLRQARMTDGLPRVVKRQEWVIALSEALGLAFGQTLDFTDKSQIYTQLDSAPEAVLDVLAVNWKIDWYDTGFTLEQKRKTVKTALMVRRLMGTAAAVKLQVHTLYPDAMIEEWFEYDGHPGCFRVIVPLPEVGISAADYRRLKTGILTTKNERSHLDVIDIRHETTGIVVVGGCSCMRQTIEVWPELTACIDVSVERKASAGSRAAERVEVWPDAIKAVEITVYRQQRGGAQMQRMLEVWPELVTQVEAAAELGECGGSAARQCVEIYPEDGGQTYGY